MGTHPIFESDFDCLTDLRLQKMPKSRRDRTIALTRTSKKHGLEYKEKTIENVRSLVDSYERCFVYSLDNARNNHLKMLRSEFKTDSRFYQGKNKLTQIALGKSNENEYKDGLHQVSEKLIGEVGLLFTNRDAQTVIDYFNKFNRAAFARANDLSTVTVLIKAGPLPQFSHAIEAHLRERLKFPTMLRDGVVELLQDVFLAKDNVRITADQSRLLKLFGCAISDFNVKLISRWEAKTGEFEEVNAATAWDKRTYNAITVEGDDQKWEWLEDGKMHELVTKSARVEKDSLMELDDENDNIASLF